MASGGRSPQNLQGLMKFCVEVTQREDTTKDSSALEMSPETGSYSTASQMRSSCSEPIKLTGAKGDKQFTESDSYWSSMDLARNKQDKALKPLGLYRFKIPGDGNCMFRAIASQLHVSQHNHRSFRLQAAQWMRKHAEELIANGLLDCEEEVEEMRKEGVWVGQAALVAMADILDINIAVFHGGDKGEIDIQHFSPFTTSATCGKKEGLLLAYLFSGHYDAIVQETNVPNPEYNEWLTDLDKETKRSEELAWDIQRHGTMLGMELYNSKYPDISSTAQSSSHLSTACPSSSLSTTSPASVTESRLDFQAHPAQSDDSEFNLSYHRSAETAYSYSPYKPRSISRQGAFHISTGSSCYPSRSDATALSSRLSELSVNSGGRRHVSTDIPVQHEYSTSSSDYSRPYSQGYREDSNYNSSHGRPTYKPNSYTTRDKQAVLKSERNSNRGAFPISYPVKIINHKRCDDPYAQRRSADEIYAEMQGFRCISRQDSVTRLRQKNINFV